MKELKILSKIKEIQSKSFYCSASWSYTVACVSLQVGKSIEHRDINSIM